MEKKRTTPDELTLSEFKAAKALAAKEANRKHRRLVKEKLAVANTVKDERIDDVLDLLREIKIMLEVAEDSDEDTSDESEEEPAQDKRGMKSKTSKKMTKLESDSEEEDPEPVKSKKKKVEPKKVKRVKPVAEIEPDGEGLQRRNPLLFNYPTYV